MQLDHEQEIIKVSIYLDKGLRDLVLELWRLGFHTQFSCENNMGMAYVLFPMLRDAKVLSCILDDNDIAYWFKLREEEYGGGASVKFLPRDIEKITILLKNIQNIPLNLPEPRKKYLNFIPRGQDGYIPKNERLHRATVI